jgi:hypothetical protein
MGQNDGDDRIRNDAKSQRLNTPRLDKRRIVNGHTIDLTE